jgi:membrane-bound lytic murein transglycosylase D
MAKALTTKAGILLSGLLAIGLATLAFPLGAQSAAPQVELVAAAPGAAPGAPEAPAASPAVFDIPMVYNDRVARMLDAYSHRVHDRFEEGLENAARYEPLIRTTFRAEGLPEDLLYVAMIESSFRPTARSGAQAQGIWQFVQSTGHRFGLKSDRLVDERADPAKATLAAARFWKTLYAEYGDWHLAMAAYNSGEGRVSSAIRRTGIDDYWQLCGQNALPRETCNYVPGVIAAGMIAKDPVKYGFDVKPADCPEFDTVVIDRPIDLRTLARQSDVALDELRDLNPELRTTRVPANKTGYPLMVPADSRPAIESTLAEIAESRRPPIAGHRARRLRERA